MPVTWQYICRLAVLVALLVVSTFAVDAAPLSDYVGKFESVDDMTLEIVVGPKNELLYAVINEARYPLLPAREDVFLNAANVEVRFVRDGEGAVSGYRLEGEAGIEENPLFRILDRTVRYSAAAWRARPQGAPQRYEYRVPDDLHDGLHVRALDDTSRLRAGLTEMVTETYAERFPYLQSVLVSQDGALVFEEYFYDFDRARKHQQRSATKTLMALLMGAAIDRGLISSVDEPIVRFFDEFEQLDPNDVLRRDVTVEDLLTMRSGFDCDDWDDASPGNENRMVRTDDWARFMLDLRMTSPPDSVASYCSGNVVLVGEILQEAAGIPLREFADEVLFKPLGITNYEWDFRPDRSNIENFVQAWLRPRDMMKVGVLIAQDGLWNGERVISEEWLSAMTAEQSNISGTPYGYFWWLRYVVNAGRRYEVPQASGNGGQKILLLDAKKTIVVFTGGNYNSPSHTNVLLQEFVLPSISE